MTLRTHLSASIFLASCLFLAAAPVVAQDKPDQLHTMSKEELNVVKVILGQERAWNAGHIDEYAEAYKDSPDLLFIGGHVSHGYAEMLREYHQVYPNKESMGTLSYSDIEPHILGERFAEIVGKYHLDRSKKAGGNADGFFTLVLEKTEKGWKIILDHSN